jgi:hypothetical protein
VREAVKLPRAAAAAERRRGGRSARRRGSRSPARLPGQRGARARQQTARAGCSPPGAGLGRLRDDETAVEAGKQRRRQDARFPAAAQDSGWLRWLGWRTLGTRAALNSLEEPT